MKTNFEIPKNLKVEIYAQVDKGRRDAGSDKHVGLDGKVYHMGRADYRPFLKKCETILNEQQSEELLNSNLIFLPYFKENKPTITLKKYFEMIQDSTLSATLFPKNLEGYISYPEDDRMFFGTLLSAQLYSASIVTVIYADQNTYYIEEIYYRLEKELPQQVFENNCNDEFEEGELMTFIKTSDLVQKKIKEGQMEGRK